MMNVEEQLEYIRKYDPEGAEKLKRLLDRKQALKEGNVYGDDQLERFIHEHPGLSPEELVRGILRDVNNHSSGIQQSDDITLLAIGYKGKY